MSVMEANTLDMAKLLTEAYELGDMINSSAEAVEYLYWKKQVDNNAEIKELVKLFAKKKEIFEECQRFGHFHPDYHAALEQVNKVQEQLEGFEAVKKFKHVEDRLDDLLYKVSETIAFAVSETIKVPSNNPLPSKGGCASGGSCSGGCG